MYRAALMLTLVVVCASQASAQSSGEGGSNPNGPFGRQGEREVASRGGEREQLPRTLAVRAEAPRLNAVAAARTIDFNIPWQTGIYQ